LGALLVLTSFASVATLVVTITEGRARDARLEALEVEVRALREPSSGEAPTPAEAGGTAGALSARAPHAALSAEDLQAIADLCAVAVSSAAPAPAAEEGAAPDPEAAAEQARARVDADVLFDGAADRGHWTAADRDALRALLGRLSPEDGQAVTQRLAQMLNDGDLQIEPGSPPF
jgi:hypothetical protein